MSNDVASSVLDDGFIYGFDLRDIQTSLHRRFGQSADHPIATCPEHYVPGRRVTGCSGFARSLQDQAQRRFDGCTGCHYPDSIGEGWVQECYQLGSKGYQQKGYQPQLRRLLAAT